jgi:hypothetical protein
MIIGGADHVVGTKPMYVANLIQAHNASPTGTHCVATLVIGRRSPAKHRARCAVEQLQLPSGIAHKKLLDIRR